MEDQPKTTSHHTLSATSSRHSSTKSLDEESDGGTEEFHGMPLGARISYHAGLNLEEKDAFKLCFPGLDGKNTGTTEGAASVAGGDSIGQLINKMRRSMGSVDPAAGQQFDLSSMSEDDGDSFEDAGQTPGGHLTPVHKTESLIDLVANIRAQDVEAAAARPTSVQSAVQAQQPIAGTSHHIGDAGKSRVDTATSGMEMSSVLKMDDPHLSVFAEGHSAHSSDGGPHHH